MVDLIGPDEVVVIANTGDDVEVHGVHVSPDPDLVTYWLADMIDPRGWGIAGDTWRAMEELEARGEPAWFRLGDRDLELCRLRTERMRAGAHLTEAHAAVVRACGVESRVLPMSDDPVRTRVKSRDRWWEFQEFMVVDRAAGPIEAVELAGAAEARPTPDVLGAVRDAEAIVIGPSNPVISIGPILALPGMREALRAAPAPVVAVSPLVGGRAVKGPTEAFMAAAGLAAGVTGVLEAYSGVIDGLVSHDPVSDDPSASRAGEVVVSREDTVMTGAGGRREVARHALDCAAMCGR
jgi:LPPG:FO 2-phospho-L-lactate transferase